MPPSARLLPTSESAYSSTAESESTKYMVEDDRDARYYKMIETIDDILLAGQDLAIYKLVVELQHIFQEGEPLEKDLPCSLILKANDLTDFLLKLMDAGYEPGITHDLGNVSSIKLRLNSIYYIV